ncbi:MAG: DUF4124 domain-containing protein [Steroidobacter sp.]
MNTAVPMICASALVLLTTVAEAAIYRCDSAGGIVYSDRPCAVDATVHENDNSRVTVYEAPSISTRASEPRPKAKAAEKAALKNAAAYAKHRASCAKLEQSLREVRSKLRTGYGVKEGERLKARQRQLAERRRTQRCG